MSWQRIVLPFTTETSPDMVEIGKRAWECYYQEKEPAGFAMFHATEGPGRGDHEDHFIVYFSPVAATACSIAGRTPNAGAEAVTASFARGISHTGTPR